MGHALLYGRPEKGVQLSLNATLQTAAHECAATFEHIRSSLREDISRSAALDAASRDLLGELAAARKLAAALREPAAGAADAAGA